MSYSDTLFNLTTNRLVIGAIIAAFCAVLAGPAVLAAVKLGTHVIRLRESAAQAKYESMVDAGDFNGEGLGWELPIVGACGLSV